MNSYQFLIRPDLIRGLALDVVKLMADGAPQPEELAGAPLLENWSFDPPIASGMAGYVWGHPTLGDGHVRTTPVVILDSGQTWARTISRFYRLGARSS